MLIIDSVNDFFKVPFRRDKLDRFVGPQKKRRGIPNDVGVTLDFPEEIVSPENRLLYALWREGEVPDYSLRILSDLKYAEFSDAVDKLLKDKKIIKTEYEKIPCGSQTQFYSLI